MRSCSLPLSNWFHSHGRRSLVGCSPWGREESNTTEWLHFHFSFLYIAEENGNPLQCSCLENPREGEAWWAAVYGVAQSRTRLKRLSSSSSSKHHSQWWETERIPSKIRNKTRMFTFAIIVKHSYGNPSYSNQRRKRSKKNPNQKRSKALTVCRWHDTLHRTP